VRAESEPIIIGAGSNVQDGCVLHTDPGAPLTIGSGVSVGHRAVLHGCTIGDDTLIGMGAIVMNGATVGSECLVAAGAILLEGTEVPDGTLVAGAPAKVRRQLSADERTNIRTNANNYRKLAGDHGHQNLEEA
jgi:carbonic anhydrase/acetyltransferase-like protein (isoleucine patch superfamily)